MPRRSFPLVSFLTFHLGKLSKHIRKGFFLHLDQDTGIGEKTTLGIKVFLDPSASLPNLDLHKYAKRKHVRQQRWQHQQPSRSLRPV